MCSATRSATISDVVQRVAGSQPFSNGRTRSPAGRGHATAAFGLVGLVLLQAVVAGQSLFGSWDIRVHGWMGNASFALAVVLTWSAWRSRAGRTAVSSAVLLFVLMFAQIGLGYAGRTSTGAASWHLPLGVTIFGLAVAHAMTTVSTSAGTRYPTTQS